MKLNLFFKMSTIYKKICGKFLNFYIYIAGFIGYDVAPKTNVPSLIVTEKDIDIEILELTKYTDKNNIIKYLKHHIMHTNDKFHPMYFFDEPLFVRFKYKNEVYQICLRQMESKNTDHTITLKQPRYLSAVVKIHNDDEGTCVTNKLVELHGPDRNFFNHIPDTIADFDILFNNHKGHIHTFDSMGNQKIHKLSQTESLSLI